MKFDRELRSQYIIPILIADSSVPIRSTIHNIRIYIDDISEFPPLPGERKLIVEKVHGMVNKLSVKIAPQCKDSIMNYLCKDVKATAGTALNVGPN